MAEAQPIGATSLPDERSWGARTWENIKSPSKWAKSITVATLGASAALTIFANTKAGEDVPAWEAGERKGGTQADIIPGRTLVEPASPSDVRRLQHTEQGPSTEIVVSQTHEDDFRENRVSNPQKLAQYAEDIRQEADDPNVKLIVVYGKINSSDTAMGPSPRTGGLGEKNWQNIKLAKDRSLNTTTELRRLLKDTKKVVVRDLQPSEQVLTPAQISKIKEYASAHGQDYRTFVQQFSLNQNRQTLTPAENEDMTLWLTPHASLASKKTTEWLEAGPDECDRVWRQRETATTARITHETPRDGVDLTSMPVPMPPVAWLRRRRKEKSEAASPSPAPANRRPVPEAVPRAATPASPPPIEPTGENAPAQPPAPIPVRPLPSRASRPVGPERGPRRRRNERLRRRAKWGAITLGGITAFATIIPTDVDREKANNTAEAACQTTESKSDKIAIKHRIGGLISTKVVDQTFLSREYTWRFNNPLADTRTKTTYDPYRRYLIDEYGNVLKQDTVPSRTVRY